MRTDWKTLSLLAACAEQAAPNDESAQRTDTDMAADPNSGMMAGTDGAAGQGMAMDYLSNAAACDVSEIESS